MEEDEFLKEIDLDIGSIKFYKKIGFLDRAYSHIPLKNKYVISAIVRYTTPVTDWKIEESRFDVAILDENLKFVELYNQLDDIDPDNLEYKIASGVWEYLTLDQVISKCKLVESLIKEI